MRSLRYEMLPRVRKVESRILGMDFVQYSCTWKDPGELMQYAGQPLRYVDKYVGYGETVDAAIRSMRHVYLQKQTEQAVARELAYKDIDKMLESSIFNEKLPTHCVATSNLPWWRRLFRV